MSTDSLPCAFVKSSFTRGHFTFWISLSLSPKFRLRPKSSQKLKSFFPLGISDLLSVIAKTKLWTEQLLNPKLINSPVDFACTRSVNQLEIKCWRMKNHFFANSHINKEIRRYQRWRQRWHCGVSSDVCYSDWLISTPVWDQSWTVWSQSLVSVKDWSKKWNDQRSVSKSAYNSRLNVRNLQLFIAIKC